MDQDTLENTFGPLTLMDDIENFHRKFGLSPIADIPTEIPDDLADFRIGFMQEELNEYVNAVRKGDLVGQADALVDLTYVVLGTAYLHNLPFQKLWNEVHSTNMKKQRAERASDSKRGHQSDVIKPEGWVGPNLITILEAYGWRRS